MSIINDIVRRMLGGFAADIEAVQIGVVDWRTPEAARRVLAAALAYLVVPGDLITDDQEAIGIMDDAAILRLAARDAVRGGASDEGLRRLAGEAEDLGYIFGDLVVKLEEFLKRMQQPDAMGQTPASVVADPEARMEMWRKIKESRDSAGAHIVAALSMDGSELVRKMRTAMRERLEEMGSKLT